MSGPRRQAGVERGLAVRGPGAQPSLGDKVAALMRPDTYPRPPSRIETRETHMSWVFLGPGRVYKLKKPVRMARLDLRSLGARQRNCENEVRLNRRLAGDVYLGSAALYRLPAGSLSLVGPGTVVDWLVVMRRLPAGRMLDAAIATGRVAPADLFPFVDRMLRFYREQAAAAGLGADAYREGFAQDIARNAERLLDPAFGLPASRVGRVLSAQERFLALRAPLLARRAQAGRIVEGHGDLRPEHVCLLDPPVVIDCLEFDRALRLLDPVDELGYLALECARLGAPRLGAAILSRYRERAGDPFDPALLAFYQAFRACVRARFGAAPPRRPGARRQRKVAAPRRPLPGPGGGLRHAAGVSGSGVLSDSATGCAVPLAGWRARRPVRPR